MNKNLKTTKWMPGHFNSMLTFQIVWVIGSFFLLSGCSISIKDENGDGCGPDVDHQYTVSAVTKSKIPFRTDGKDTLVYYNNNHDTVVLKGTGVLYKKPENSFDRSPNPNCVVMHHYHYEVLEYNFVSDERPDLLGLTFYIYFRMDAENKVYEVANFTRFSDEQNYLFMTAQGEGYTETDVLNKETNYNASLPINNKKYTGSWISSLSDYRVFYNYHFGALSIETNGVAWYKKI